MVRGKLDSSTQREIIIARKLFEDNKTAINSKDYAAFRGLKLFSSEHKERKNSSNSGFNQRKQLQGDAALFFNWDPSEPKSRNNITNAICSYAKAHHLQVEGDRRMLDLNSDAGKKLASLLKIPPDTEKIPYCWIQKYTGSLFLPSEKAEAEPMVIKDAEVDDKVEAAEADQDCKDKAADVKAADVKAADVKAADVKAADVKAADVKAADVKSADVKSADVKAADVKAADAPKKRRVKKS